jgi:hypothetical protein
VPPKKLVIRAGFGVLALLVGAAAWAALNVPVLKARYAARQMRNAASGDDRARAAETLTSLGDPGLARLVEFIRGGDDACRSAAAGAIERRLDALPDADPWAGAAAERLLDLAGNCDPAAQRAVLELLPALLKRTGPAHAAKCRTVVVAGLTAADPAARALAVRLAMHPNVKLRAEVVPLLGDSAPQVRCAALIAVAAVTEGEPLVADEDLFRWLHDRDEAVRQVCHGVLVSRDRTEAEISLGRRLTHPDPRERLKFLLDLRYDEELADPVPWLERLSRDIEPAVRAGAARVALEITGDRRLSSPSWVSRVADADPDPTVRRVARYFRGEPLRHFGGGLGAMSNPQ